MSVSAVSAGETKTTNNDQLFYGFKFVRQLTIPVNLFANSTQAMNDGIQRNPYSHWKPEDGGERPPCCHEVCKGYDLTTCADCGQKSIISKERVTIEERRKAKIKQEDANNMNHMSMLHSCGVRVDWLLAFTFDHDCWNETTWWVNRHIIKEATRETRCRYAHLDEMKEYVGPADVFISHPWGGKWGDVVLAACHGASKQRMVWIDLFAVRQWPGKDLDLNFRGMLGKCKALIVSVAPVESLIEMLWWDNWGNFLSTPEGASIKKSNPFFRLWCAVEIAEALNLGIPVVVKSGTALKCEDGTVTYDTSRDCLGMLMAHLLYMVDVESCECAIRADYEREMAAIVDMEGGVVSVNKSIKGVVLGAFTSSSYNVLEIDAAVCGELEGFRSLKIAAGCTGKERNLSMRVLKAAGAGGRSEILRELLTRWQEGEWVGKEEDIEKERSLWLQRVINNSMVLISASGGGHIQAVRMLLKVVGIEVDISDSNGATAMYAACSGGYPDLVDALLCANCEVNRPRKDGTSPFLGACIMNHSNVVQRLLLVKGIDVNKASTEGKYACASPLILAGYLGRFDLVEILLQHPEIDRNSEFQGRKMFEWVQPEARAKGWEFLESQIDHEGRRNVIKDLL
jgi:hypothetical protein